MQIQYYALVYQAGIANVFKCRIHPKQTNADSSARQRVLQGDFRQCGNFCLGLHEMGARVIPAWCNQAGDISALLWHFTDFNQAPFSDSFIRCFGIAEMERAT